MLPTFLVASDVLRFRLDIRKHLFTARVLKHYNRLPRVVINALNLSVFKRHLGNALSKIFNYCSAQKWSGSWTIIRLL